MSKKVLLEYHHETDEITIKSEFEDINDTLKMIGLSYDKWLKEQVGLKCEKCGTYIGYGWEFCSKCGQDV